MEPTRTLVAAGAVGTSIGRRAALRGSAAAALGISTLALPTAAQAFSLTSEGAPLASVTVYWSERGSGSTTNGRIGRLVYRGFGQGVDNIQNGWVTGLKDPRSLVANSGFLYWSVPNAGGDTAAQGVWRVSLADPSSPQRVVARAGIIGLDVAGDDLYYAVIGDGIFRTAKDGSGTPTELVDVTAQIWDVKVAGETLLFSDIDNARVMIAPKAGGSATLFASMTEGPRSIWVADGTVYVARSDSGGVRKFSLADGTSSGGFAAAGFVSGIQVVGSAVFVSTSNSTRLAASGLDGGNRDVFARPFETPETITSNNTTEGIAVVL
jgi:hypothetical protein